MFLSYPEAHLRVFLKIIEPGNVEVQIRSCKEPNPKYRSNLVSRPLVGNTDEGGSVRGGCDGVKLRVGGVKFGSGDVGYGSQAVCSMPSRGAGRFNRDSDHLFTFRLAFQLVFARVNIFKFISVSRTPKFYENLKRILNLGAVIDTKKVCRS